MKNVQLMKRLEVPYPFHFFCEERHSVSKVLEIAQELYQEFIDHYGEDMKTPPSLQMLCRMATVFFGQESVARMILRGDFNGRETFQDDYMEYIIERFAEQDMDIDTFIDYLWNVVFGEFVLIPNDERYYAWFERDIMLAFDTLRLHYFNGKWGAKMHLYYYRKGSEPDPAIEFVRNNPIMEVW